MWCRVSAAVHNNHSANMTTKPLPFLPGYTFNLQPVCIDAAAVDVFNDVLLAGI